MTMAAVRTVRSRLTWLTDFGSGFWLDPRLAFGREDFFFGMRFALVLGSD
jgi:hypothetical protein